MSRRRPLPFVRNRFLPLSAEERFSNQTHQAGEITLLLSPGWESVHRADLSICPAERMVTSARDRFLYHEGRRKAAGKIPHQQGSEPDPQPCHLLHHVALVKRKQRPRRNAVPECLPPANLCVHLGVFWEHHKPSGTLTHVVCGSW